MAREREREHGDTVDAPDGRRPRVELPVGALDAEVDEEVAGEVAHARERHKADEAQAVQLPEEGERDAHDPHDGDPDLSRGQHVVPRLAVRIAVHLDDRREGVADDDEVADQQPHGEEEDEEVVGVPCPRGDLLGDPLEVDADLALADGLVLLQGVLDDLVGGSRQQPDGVPAEERKQRSQQQAEDDADLGVGGRERQDARAHRGVDEVEDGRLQAGALLLGLDRDLDVVVRALDRDGAAADVGLDGRAGLELQGALERRIVNDCFFAFSRIVAAYHTLSRIVTLFSSFSRAKNRINVK